MSDPSSPTPRVPRRRRRGAPQPQAATTAFPWAARSLWAPLAPALVSWNSLAEPASSLAHGIAIPLALVLSSVLATIRLSLLRSVPARVLEPVEDAERRALLAPLLERVDPLATTARVLQLALELAFGLLVLLAIAADRVLDTRTVLITWAIVVPLLVIGGEVLPSLYAGGRGDDLLRRRLPLIAAILRPLSLVGRLFEGLRRWLRSSVGLEDDPAATRRVVEGLRGVVVESEFEGELDATEREIIGNVMEFHDVDAAAIMTPRTEILGVELGQGVRGAIRVAAECGHSRIPVYSGSLDTIIGIFSVRDVLELVDEERLDSAELSELLRPPYFVPETKRVSDLLAEFRRNRVKLAVVLDEYGGTSGLLTVSDVLGELVGELLDEHDDDEPPMLQLVEPETWELDAGLRVSEVNEELDLELPDESDFETIGGFVLAELGHFPKPGERVLAEGVEIVVLESTDRRVLKLRLHRGAYEPAERIGAAT